MRALTLLPLLLPLPAWAADFTLDSRVTAATVFPAGAALTREAEFDLPAGTHRLIVPDMPVRDAEGLRVTAGGVTLGSVTIRDDLTPPRDAETRAAVAAAEAEVERAEEALNAARDEVRAIRLTADAARARIEFLKDLNTAEGLAGAGVDTLRDLSRMVGEEVLAAERQALAAEGEARRAEAGIEDLVEALARAKQALAAVDVEAEDRAYVTVTVEAAEPVTGLLTFAYVTNGAGWEPVYRVHLARGDDPALRIERGAHVGQNTGETWTDVALTLSTVRPSGQTRPGEVHPWLRRIDDPVPEPSPRKMLSDSAQGAIMPAPMAESAMVAEERAAMAFDGLNATYSYGPPVTIATGAETVRIALGEIELSPEIVARAVPLYDRTAFLMAEAENDAVELILPSRSSEFYLDGTFAGLRPTPLIAAGDEVEFSFGPIEGLRLTRHVLDRSEGDRGVITRSNRQREQVEITVENLTGESWPVRLIDRVPYSEQEDLEIEWSARPEPTEVNVEDQRGILAWEFDIAPGAEQAIRLDQELTWPAEKVLR
ncbi:MAG: DUF4139 domain-containing protein [Pseudooceanicola sp.]